MLQTNGMQITAAVFDLDGTLTDSRPGILRCLRVALDEAHVSWTGPLEWFIGPPIEYSMDRLMPDADPAARDAVVRTYRDCYDQQGWSENAVYAGVPATLAALREQGIPLFICTSKREHFATRVLEAFGLAQYFRAIYADRGDRPHSKVDLLAELVREQQLDPSGTVMIGDRHYDIEAARANQMRSIAVTYGYGTREELSAAAPDSFADTPAAILRILQPAASAPSSR